MKKNEHSVTITQEDQDAYSVPVRHRHITAGGVAGALALGTMLGVGVNTLAHQGDHEHNQEVKMIKQSLKSTGEFWGGGFETQPSAKLYDSPSFQKDTAEGLSDNLSDQQLPEGVKLTFPEGVVLVSDSADNRFAVVVVPTKGRVGPVDYPTNIDDLAEHAKLIPFADMFPDKDARNILPEPIGDQIEGVLGSLPANGFETVEPIR